MIRFDKVSFTYQESLQNGGLRDVDLTINKGECVLLWAKRLWENHIDPSCEWPDSILLSGRSHRDNLC